MLSVGRSGARSWVFPSFPHHVEPASDLSPVSPKVWLKSGIRVGPPTEVTRPQRKPSRTTTAPPPFVGAPQGEQSREKVPDHATAGELPSSASSFPSCKPHEIRFPILCPGRRRTESKDGEALTGKIIHLERPHHIMRVKFLKGHIVHLPAPLPGSAGPRWGVGRGNLHRNESRWHCGVQRSGGDLLVIQKRPSRLRGPDTCLLLLGGGGPHRGGPAPPEGSHKASSGGESSREAPVVRRGGGRVIPADGADQQEYARGTALFPFFFN